MEVGTVDWVVNSFPNLDSIALISYFLTESEVTSMSNASIRPLVETASATITTAACGGGDGDTVPAEVGSGISQTVSTNTSSGTTGGDGDTVPAEVGAGISQIVSSIISTVAAGGPSPLTAAVDGGTVPAEAGVEVAHIDRTLHNKSIDATSRPTDGNSLTFRFFSINLTLH